MRDRDGKFTPPFDKALKDAGFTVRKSAPQSPNTQAFVERFIQTLQQEYRDYFIPVGSKHLDHLVAETVAHYHDERPRQALDNGLLEPVPKSKSRRKDRAKPPDEATIPLPEVCAPRSRKLSFRGSATHRRLTSGLLLRFPIATMSTSRGVQTVGAQIAQGRWQMSSPARHF
jgi:hypothetical protein